jgi:lipopolysaccharide export system protein LptA
MKKLIAIAGVIVGIACFPTREAAQDATGLIPSTMSADSNVERDGVFYAKGNVRIIIGGTTITADEAEIRRTSEYRMRDVTLKGNVHMSYRLNHD